MQFNFIFRSFFLFGATATVGHGLLIHEFTRPNTQLRTPVGRKLLELEDEVTSDDDKCRCLANDIEVQWELPLTENSITVEVTCWLRKN